MEQTLLMISLISSLARMTLMWILIQAARRPFSVARLLPALTTLLSMTHSLERKHHPFLL
ncbi:hypothetical protein ZEAMMB73_Zm00001d035765 [Zea mays]|uniref:Uncharacterized protein n=1 Tax=Zea mays TaxID=4577 RepID=A0A1D6LIP9_MAIZE|nr:hypothetical protein ZEAMMB73_Zm00001d035765 [Zea mays]